MNAVVRIAGKQYMVHTGGELLVDKLDSVIGDILKFPDVLMISDGGKTIVGTPTVKGALVKATVVSHGKGEKISVRRYKSKVRHRRAIGFRSKITTLKIDSISA